MRAVPCVHKDEDRAIVGIRLVLSFRAAAIDFEDVTHRLPKHLSCANRSHKQS